MKKHVEIVGEEGGIDQGGDGEDVSKKKPRGYWTQDEGNQMRQWFDEFAEKRGIDTTNPQDWYKVRWKQVYYTEGSKSVLSHFNWSYKRAIVELYPELNMCIENFLFHNRDWKEARNKRDFFDDFAKEKNFDPLNPENWYSVTKAAVVDHGGRGLICKYGSFGLALLDVYPDIGLKKELIIKQEDWRSPKRRREFMDNFAKSRNFDPLVPNNWYRITHSDIIKAGGKGVINYYKASHLRAIVALYPDIPLWIEKFPAFREWKDAKFQRIFLDKFAQERAFDPLMPTNWLRVLKKDIRKAGGGKYLDLYDGSIAMLVRTVYNSKGKGSDMAAR